MSVIKNKKLLRFVVISVLCLSSLSYYNIKNDSNLFDFTDLSYPVNNQNDQTQQDDSEKDPENNQDTDSSQPVKNTLIPGNYKLQGYFSHDSFLSLDDDGTVYVVEKYENMYDQGNLSVYKNLEMDKNIPSTWPDSSNTYYYLTEGTSPYTNSTMYTPAFTEDTELAGKIYVLTHMKDSHNKVVLEFKIRIKLFLFNPLDQNTTEILSYEEVLQGNLVESDQKIFEPELSSSITIPEGYRLKLAIEGKVSSTKHDADIELRTSRNLQGNQYTWDIIDAGEYSNTYTFEDYDYVFGMQLKYRGLSYPDISITGAENETVYYEEKDIQISVTGSETQAYRWDDDTFTSWEGTDVNTSLPLTDGWHYLEIKASDEYNNTRIDLYQIGYDSTPSDVNLISPANNTIIAGGTLLNFTVESGASNVTYEWNNNGSIFDLLSQPEYDIYAPTEDKFHNLTIYINDTLLYCEKFYLFNIDSTVPSIILYNVVNGSTYSPNKKIEVNITDIKSSITVKYKWDGQEYRTWSPSTGTIYVEYLPSTGGWNNLTVSATDAFGYENLTIFRFYVDTTILLVELTTMVNNSYYYGGNTVNVTVTGHNDTVKFKWNEDEIQDGLLLIVDGILILDGIYALPSDTNRFHYLYLFVGDKSDVENPFFFNFTIDQLAPTITPDSDYNNTRFLDTTIFTFQIADNYTTTNELIVYISIDGGANQTLSSPFEYALLYLSDGNHNLTIYAFDIAGNYDVIFLTFIVDTTAPVIEIAIDGLVELSDGSLYVPADANVNITITEDDPSFTTVFSWDNAEYIIFTSSFSLSYPDGTGVLSIKAYDSLNNTNILNITLTIDSQAPSTTILFPFDGSKINNMTVLNFVVEDVKTDTIKILEASWDITSSIWFTISFDSNGYFELTLLDIYIDLELTSATLSFRGEDIVGNTLTYIFNFEIDFTPPNLGVYLYDAETSKYYLFSNNSFIRGYYNIWYNASENDDLSSFVYSWDNGFEEILNATGLIDVPDLDGEHNITFTLKDDTGEGATANEISLTFILIVDDINIGYISVPDNYPTNNTIRMKYKDEYIFTVNVSDAIENTALTGLTYAVVKDSQTNLNLSSSQLDNITYQFIIRGTNITQEIGTIIEIQFWQFENHKQSLYLNFIIERQKGNIVIQSITEEIIYGEEINITLSLYDDLNVSSQEIENIFINGTSVDFIINYDDFSVLISYSGYPANKGNYTLIIEVYSAFYHDIISDPTIMSVEVSPIPVLLSVSISNTTITVGTNLIVYASLTDFYGNPISLQEVVFEFYIYYKEGTYALPSDFDDYITELVYTNDIGLAQASFEMTEEIDYVIVNVKYEGNNVLDSISFTLEEPIYSIILDLGIPRYLLIIIIISSLVLMALVSFIVYKKTRPKPFEQLMEQIDEEEIELKIHDICLGVILSIFDQKKGPIPLLDVTSLEIESNRKRISLGKDNFIIKICDQAFSSLGFDDAADARRTGTIRLPSEGMTGYIHGVRLENKKARGGYENLSLIILTQEQYGSILIGHEEFLFGKIDELEKNLKSQKSLKEIQNHIQDLRILSTRIVLAGLKEEVEVEE